MPPRHDVTVLLDAARAGDRDAPGKLLPLLYDELRELARAYMAREKRDHTLQATALVHEAYLRMVDVNQIEWQGRAHFFAVAATAMRRILVDHARGRARVKRGSAGRKLTLDTALLVAADPNDELAALDEALDRLATLTPRRAQVVELRFFGGLSTDEAAEVLRVSSRTVEGDWSFAKAWLHRELTRDSPP